MDNYVITTHIELPAASQAEAEDLVMGMDIVDVNGISIEEVYIEIEKVVKV